MAYEDGEIEDGEVAEDGEVRDETPNTNGTENSDKRKATSPPRAEDAAKRVKVDQPENGAEEGECDESDEGEINSPEPEPMEVDKRKTEDGELELDLSDVELFQDKNISDIDWSVILPDGIPTLPPPSAADERPSFSIASILRCAKVQKHSSYLIRNEKLLSSLESILASETASADQPKSEPTNSNCSTSNTTPRHHCNLKHIIAENRAKLGLNGNVPLRPFMPPNRFNGALAHEVTQFILDGHR